MAGCCTGCNCSWDSFRQYRRSIYSAIHGLRDSGRTFWLLCLTSVLQSFSYFAIALILTTYLETVIHLQDMGAGTLYGLFGASFCVWTMLIGATVDVVGYRWVLGVGQLLAAVGKILVLVAFVVQMPWLFYVGLFAVNAAGEAFSNIAIDVGITHALPSSTRKVGYAVAYAAANIGAIAAGFSVDAVRRVAADGFTIGGVTFDGLHIIFMSAASTALLSLFLVPLMRARKAEGSRNKYTYNHMDDNEHYSTKRSWFNRLGKSLGGLCKWDFIRFAALVPIMINVRSLFRYMDSAFPLYMTRTYGEGVLFGVFFSINPFLIVVLAPLIQILAMRVPALQCITIGTWISAFSPFFLALSAPHLLNVTGVILFAVMLAIGEALWSPRIKAYASEIGGPERVGLYMSAQSLILFLSKLPAGMLSGYLMTRYCPVDAPTCDGLALWCIVGGLALVSPVLLTVLYRWLYIPKRAKNNTVDPMFDMTLDSSESETDLEASRHHVPLDTSAAHSTHSSGSDGVESSRLFTDNDHELTNPFDDSD